MVKIPVPRKLPRPILPERRVRNGLLPSHLTTHHIARVCQFVLAHGRKVVFQGALPMEDPGSNSGEFAQFRGLCHTGEASTSLSNREQLRLKVIATVIPNSQLWFEVDDGTSTTTADSKFYKATGSSSFTQENIGVLITDLEVLPDTEYEWRTYFDGTGGLRNLMSLSVFESTLGVINTDDLIDHRKYYNKAPIHDADVEELVMAPHKLWKHNGAQLLAISQNKSEEPFEVTSTSYVNLYDASASTTVDSTTPGHYIQTEFLNPYHTDDISVVFAAYGHNTGQDGYVRIADENGQIAQLGPFTGTTGEWLKTTTTLKGGSSGNHKIDIHALTGSGTFSIEAVSIYAYET